jgi:micrococcal nuclease
MVPFVRNVGLLAIAVVPALAWINRPSTGRDVVEAPAIVAPDFATRESYAVVRVVDGDTVVVDIEGVKTKVRLVGVDTPETVDPRKPVEAYGKEASEFTKNLLAGERVYLVDDKPSGTLDRYGRRLAYLYRAPDGLFVNLEIVRQGYGHAYLRYPFEKMETFRQFEGRAREAEKGLWGKRAFDESMDASAAQSASIKTTVYVSRTGSKYHLESCRYLPEFRISKTLVEARRGFGACGVCDSPH